MVPRPWRPSGNRTGQPCPSALPQCPVLPVSVVSGLHGAIVVALPLALRVAAWRIYGHGPLTPGDECIGRPGWGLGRPPCPRFLAPPLPRTTQQLHPHREPVATRAAATVLLLRDAPDAAGAGGLEVLMTRRSAQASFAPG